MFYRRKIILALLQLFDEYEELVCTAGFRENGSWIRIILFNLDSDPMRSSTANTSGSKLI
jgi:hypothetical protein